VDSDGFSFPQQTAGGIQDEFNRKGLISGQREKKASFRRRSIRRKP
jgi:hypothetical protein